MNAYELPDQTIPQDCIADAARSMALDALWGLSAEATVWRIGEARVSETAQTIVVAVRAEADGNYCPTCRAYGERTVCLTFVQCKPGTYIPLGLPRM
jgi:hypothetical protein